MILIGMSGCSQDRTLTELPTDDNENIKISNNDFNGRTSFNTVFGDQIVSTRRPSIAAQFQYPLQSSDVRQPDIVGSGHFEQANAMLQLHTGNDVNGSAGVESQQYLRYIPGHETQALFTIVFSSNTNTMQRAGIFDKENGFYINWDGENMTANRRRLGVDYSHAINITDILDGEDLNPAKGNIYSISYGYLGFAPITFAAMNPDGSWSALYKIEYPNNNTETHIAQTFLPLRAETTNNGNTNDTILKVGSIWGGIVDGDIKPGTETDPTARFFTQSSPIRTTANGILFSFRSKVSYGGIDNRVNSLLKLVSCSTDGNKPVEFRLLKNPTFVSATWQNVSNDSVLEYSTDLVLDIGAEDGEAFITWDMARSDSFFEDVSAQNLLLAPNGTAVFYYTSSSTTEAKCGIRWAELI